MNLVLLLLLLTFCNILLSYSLVLIQTITTPGIPVRRNTAGYPIIFILKKDGTLRLYINYQELNNITIKNSYPLPLISELQNKLQKVKWFTKLDIPEAYNQIRIKKENK